MVARADWRVERYEHARWLVSSAEVGWLTTYEGRATPSRVPLEVGTPIGSPVDIAEDPSDAARRLVLALRVADGHDERLADVPVATMLICEPPVPGVPDDLVASVALYGRVRILDGPGAAGACALLRRAHSHLDGVLDADSSVLPAMLDVTGVRHQRRGGDNLLLDLPRFLSTPSAPPRPMRVMLDHLVSDHRDLLLRLVRGAGGPTDPEHVEPVALRPDRLDCNVLTRSGVHQVAARFDRPVSDNAELGVQLHRLVQRGGCCHHCAQRRLG
jgi:hypothetical protein